MEQDWIHTEISSTGVIWPSTSQQVLVTLLPTRESAILSDEWTGNLLLNLRVFELSNWTRVYAATDRWVWEDKNHDRIVIKSDISAIYVLDGMASTQPSQFCAEVIMGSSRDFSRIFNGTQTCLNSQNIASWLSMVWAYISEDRNLHVHQVGDCGVLVFGNDGNVKFCADNQVDFYVKTFPITREFQEFLLEYKQLKIVKQFQRHVDTLPKDPLQWSFGSYHTYDPVKLQSWDTVMLFSDIVWCNFSLPELETLVRENPDTMKLYSTIAMILYRKMQLDRDQLDGIADYNLYYNSDLFPSTWNQSLVLFRVP